jgi:hypothetical protein
MIIVIEIKIHVISWTWWCMPTALGRQRQESSEFKANLDYFVRPYLENKSILSLE